MEAFDVFVRSYETGLPLVTLTVSGNMTIGKLKRMFAEQYSDKFYSEKQQVWYNGVPLKRDYMLLKDYDLKPASTIFIQDKGIQVSYRLSKILINIGPIITFLLFFVFRQQIYTFTMNDPLIANNLRELSYPQDLGFKMGLIHFIKRTYECIGVHIFSKQTKSLNKLCWDIAYTWLFFGVGVPYYLFHPFYIEAFWGSNPLNYYTHIIYYTLLGTFAFCELMNLLCHVHLKSFRRKHGDPRLGIPTKHGFSHVSSANYFWEICAWGIFTLANQTLIAFIFFIVSFFKMNHSAQKKHLRYIAEFKKAYPAEDRRAFLPYLF